MNFENQIGDTEKPAEENKEEMLQVCAWCDQEQGIDRTNGPVVTHGICEKHAAIMRKEMRQE